MDTYKFYYDESEHSRKINYNTVTAPNYYDNFVTVVVGGRKKRKRKFSRNMRTLKINMLTVRIETEN